VRDRFGIFGTVARTRKLSTFGNDVKNTQHKVLLSIVNSMHIAPLAGDTLPSKSFSIISVLVKS